MKFKGLICLIIGIIASVTMSISVYAAASISIGQVTTTTVSKVEYVVIPVYYNTTDSSKGLSSYGVQVIYDGNDFDSETYRVIGEAKDDWGISLGNPDISAELTDESTGRNYRILGWASSTDAIPDENNQVKLFSLYLKPSSDASKAASEFTSSDFGVKIDNLAYGDSVLDVSDSYYTYVIYDVPKTVDENWKYGYIKEMYVTITDAATGEVLKEKIQLTNYIEDDDYYSFIVNLTEETKGYTSQIKSIVDVEFSALVTDEEGLYFTEKTLETMEDIEVEYLEAIS